MPKKRTPHSTTTTDNTAGLPLVLSLAEAAEVTGLSQKTIMRRIEDGTLTAVRLRPKSFASNVIRY